jgi:hypothetical protein
MLTAYAQFEIRGRSSVDFVRDMMGAFMIGPVGTGPFLLGPWTQTDFFAENRLGQTSWSANEMALETGNGCLNGKLARATRGCSPGKGLGIKAQGWEDAVLGQSSETSQMRPSDRRCLS